MRTFRTALAAFAGGVVMWLLAGLWHLVIVPGFYDKGIGTSHHKEGVLILFAYALLAGLMAGAFVAYYLRRDQGSRNPILDGLKLGLLVGLLWVTPHAMVRTGAHGGSLTYLIVNGLWHLAEQGTGGAIMGLVFGIVYRNRRTEIGRCSESGTRAAVTP